MLFELWGLDLRLEEKLICKKGQMKKQVREKGVSASNWWDAGLWTATCRCRHHRGQRSRPRSCRLPSGMPHLPPSRPAATLRPACTTRPKKPASFSSSPKFASVPSCTLSPGWIQHRGSGEGSTLPYFQETVQTYMATRAMKSASYWLFRCPFPRLSLVTALPCLNPTMVEWLFCLLIIAENLIKITSHQLLPSDFFLCDCTSFFCFNYLVFICGTHIVSALWIDFLLLAACSSEFKLVLLLHSLCVAVDEDNSSVPKMPNVLKENDAIRLGAWYQNIFPWQKC